MKRCDHPVREIKKQYTGVRGGFFERTTPIPVSTAEATNEWRQPVEGYKTKERVKDGPVLEDKKSNYDFEQQVLDSFGAADDEVMNVPYVDWTALFLLGYLRQRDSYEDELTRKLAASDFGVARLGVVYHTLRQMEKEGLVVSESDGFDRGPSQRRFAITGLGKAYLECLANALTQYRKEMALFLRIYDEQCDLRRAAVEAAKLQDRTRGDQEGCS
jgi:DNA-binding PadR family transcriptional regulator